MNVVDCETAETAIASLESVLEQPRTRIESVLADLDLEHLYVEDRAQWASAPTEDLILAHLLRACQRQAHELRVDRVCWFHLSRVPDPTTFTQGLQTLPERLESIWSHLGTLAVKHGMQPQVWAEFRQTFGRSGGHMARLYSMKTGGQIHWGPFAMLVREIASRPEDVGNHDYLAVPEIVEDICVTCAEETGYELLPAFEQDARPCIIKFAAKPLYFSVLPEVAAYVHAHVWGLDLPSYCNTCFNGNGEPIPPRDILDIQIVA